MAYRTIQCLCPILLRGGRRFHCRRTHVQRLRLPGGVPQHRARRSIEVNENENEWFNPRFPSFALHMHIPPRRVSKPAPKPTPKPTWVQCGTIRLITVRVRWSFMVREFTRRTVVDPRRRPLLQADFTRSFYLALAAASVAVPRVTAQFVLAHWLILGRYHAVTPSVIPAILAEEACSQTKHSFNNRKQNMFSIQ